MSSYVLVTVVAVLGTGPVMASANPRCGSSGPARLPLSVEARPAPGPDWTYVAPLSMTPCSQERSPSPLSAPSAAGIPSLPVAAPVVTTMPVSRLPQPGIPIVCPARPSRPVAGPGPSAIAKRPLERDVVDVCQASVQPSMPESPRSTPQVSYPADAGSGPVLPCQPVTLV